MQTPVLVLNVGDVLLGGLVIGIALIVAILYSPDAGKPRAGSVAASESISTTPNSPAGDHARHTAAHAIATLGQEALTEMTAIRKRREAARAEHGELTPEEGAFLDQAIADQLASVQEDYARRVRALKEEQDDN